MNKRDLIIFFLVEFASVALAIASFRLIPIMFVAALVASSGFLFLGVFVFLKSRKWLDRNKSFTYWLAIIHLFGSTLPLSIVYVLTQAGLEIPILQENFPMLHVFASQVVKALIVATFIDFVRLFFRKA